MKDILMTLAGVALLSFLASPALAQDRKLVNVVHDKKQLDVPLQILARHGAQIYANEVKDGKDTMGSQVVRAARAFEQFYVYAAPAWVESKIAKSDGEFLVGKKKDGQVEGWIKATEAVVWKHKMCVTFAPRGTGDDARRPVVMFNDVKRLRKLDLAEDRPAQANTLYEKIEKRELDGLGIVAMEPTMEINLQENFYLIPTVDAYAVNVEGEDRWLLSVACATESDGEGEAPTEPQIPDDKVSQKALDALRVDLVFVIDTTGSMAPYIQRTIQNVKDIASRISQRSDLKDKLRFGVWGYRDSDKRGRDQYVAKNYTPQLQSVDEFKKTLEGVEAPRGAGGRDLPEEVFVGVSKAIEETAWSGDGMQGAPGSIRFLLVMGDAPGVDGTRFQGSDRNSVSEMTAKGLNSLARGRGIDILTMHIHNDRVKGYLRGEYEGYRQWIERQFRELSLSPGLQGAEGNAYFYVESEAAFERAAKEMSSEVINLVKNATEGKLDIKALAGVGGGEPTKTPAPAAPTGKGDDAGNLMSAIANRAAMRFLGGQMGKEAPRDIIAWIPDHDLVNPGYPTVVPRVLLTKGELSSLAERLEGLLKAFADREIEGAEALQKLKDETGGTILDGSTTDLLRMLPYRSRVLGLTDDEFESMSASEESRFLNELNGKLKYYERIAASTTEWIKFNPGDEPNEHRYPVELAMLP